MHEVETAEFQNFRLLEMDKAIVRRLDEGWTVLNMMPGSNAIIHVTFMRKSLFRR